MPDCSVLIVHAHELVRSALCVALHGRDGVVVVGDAGELTGALEVAGRLGPDVILFDVSPAHGLTLGAIGELLDASGPRARVVIVTASHDNEFKREAVASGARGIVTTDQSLETLATAIDKVHGGELWIERHVLDGIVYSRQARTGPDAAIRQLTAREHQVVRLLADGLKNKEIARRLAVSDTTVRHHLTSIFAKLELADRLSVVVFAYRNHLVSTDRIASSSDTAARHSERLHLVAANRARS